MAPPRSEVVIVEIKDVDEPVLFEGAVVKGGGDGLQDKHIALEDIGDEAKLVDATGNCMIGLSRRRRTRF